MFVSPFEVYPVAGVVADFQECYFDRRNLPIIISNDPFKETTIAVKIAAQSMTAGKLKSLIGDIEKDWRAIFPGKPFAYSFLNESIAKMYAKDLRTERVINVAMGITVFISCLGLLSLTIFSTERRSREIGIRKVLGATVSGIMVMLCKEIVVLIVTPFASYLMYNWLQGFVYRTPFGILLFIAAGAAAIGIALLTVGLQAMKAAMANPVKSLRTE